MLNLFLLKACQARPENLEETTWVQRSNQEGTTCQEHFTRVRSNYCSCTLTTVHVSHYSISWKFQVRDNVRDLITSTLKKVYNLFENVGLFMQCLPHDNILRCGFNFAQAELDIIRYLTQTNVSYFKAIISDISGLLEACIGGKNIEFLTALLSA